MRRLYSPSAVCVILFSLAALCAAWPRASGLPVAPAKAVSSDPPPRTLGVASCAAMACHGANGPKGSKGSEYSTWITVDPHAKAYEALSKPESQQMHKNLAAADKDKKNYGKYAAANDNPLCLKCHAMGDGATPEMQTDGVGCERCHGPAENWKSTHYLYTFDRNTPGFHDLLKLTARAETCTQCHVGEKNQEVNHDLIAAGHPRLRFEFAAYHANYPKHWADTGEKERDPAFEERAWLVGQLVSAEAALKLLASRTEGKDPITHEPKPWPEFAEYECAACHHGLKKPSFRQKRDLKKAEAGVKVDSGALPWGTWYYSIMPVLEKQVPGAEMKKLQALLDKLHRNLGKRLPPPGAVRSDALDAAKLIKGWLTRVKDRPLSSQKVTALMTALAKKDDLVQSGWDGAVQVYLGLAAGHNALCDMDPAFQATSPLRRPLLKMRDDLRAAFGKEVRPLYDSPLNYDPTLLGNDLKNVRKRLK
jgi:hypothetical protein